MTPVRYEGSDQVIPQGWMVLEDTFFPTLKDAKCAAARLFINVSGVIVKPFLTGYRLSYWRRIKVYA